MTIWEEKELQQLSRLDNAFWKEHKDFQQAFRAYLLKHGMRLNTNFVYESGIDCVFVFLEDNPIFIIGLPPVSNYPVQETEYTDRYMRTIKEELVAV